MQSITTWTFKPGEPLALASGYADLEGTTLLYSAENSYVALFPDKKLSPNSWAELKESLGTFEPGALSIPRWVGYFSYEFPLGEALFYRPTVVVHYHHPSGVATLYSDHALELDRTRALSQEVNYKLVHRSDSRAGYCEKVEQTLEWIRAGDLYQLNLSQSFLFEGSADPFTLFERVVSRNPASHTAYMQCGDLTIVSSSPERFLQRRGPLLKSQPIKGTAPRKQDPLEDAASKEALRRSPKERAELLMITDLMRNDLSQVCKPGSVIVDKLWHLETYTNVFHLVSHLQGEIDPSEHPIDHIEPLFPGGSITGCPKPRAMQRIVELEERPREVYTGSIGYIAENGDFDCNIAIRTLAFTPSHLKVDLGGGIVADSNPESEYEETLHKGATLFEVLGHSLLSGSVCSPK